MSDKAQSLFDEAMQANLSGNTGRAADLLKQTVELDPENVDAWVELAKLLTDRDERRMALTTIINLDPDNSYAKAELESVEKPKSAVDENAEIVPGIPRKQARMIGLGLAGYTLIVCTVTLLITSAINGNKAAAADRVAQLYNAQTSTQDTIYQVGTQGVLTATQSAVDAAATSLALNSPTPTATSTRSFVLPTEILPTETPTQMSFRILDAPPVLSGQILAWGGLDIRSKEYLTLRTYPLSQPGQFSKLNSELGRNPIMSADGSVTAFEQWRSDGSRLYMNVLEPVTPGGTLDALISSSYLVIDLRNPSLSRDAKRIAFIATDYNTKAVEPYVADLTNLMSPKFYKLNQDTASYPSVTLSPDGNTAVAVRFDGTTTDLVAFDLTNLPAAAGAPAPVTPDGLATPLSAPPAAVNITIRPLTTDGNSLIESAPSFSHDGTRIVYEASTSSTPDSHDLYIVNFGAAPGTAVPIMTLDGDDVNPNFSPDGTMVVFASNRQTGVYNIFIFDTNTKVTYQLTDDSSDVYPGWWAN